jgi:hypothetical protein
MMRFVGGLRKPSGADALESTASIARLSELQAWLERIEYGHARGPVEIPMGVLFPPAADEQENGPSHQLSHDVA